MSIFSLGFFGRSAVLAGVIGICTAAGASTPTLGAMAAAVERGDADEASRLGVLAGPAVVEDGLRSQLRSTQLAAVAAAPMVEARSELLPELATLAQSGDRRVAIPALRAARTIARELATAAGDGETADDLDPDDLTTWRALFEGLVANPHRFVEVRVLAIDTVAALSRVITPTEVGFDLAGVLGDPDPAIRLIAILNVPRPTPASARTALVSAVTSDVDDAVALAAAQVLCGDEPAPAVALLGVPGRDRIKKLVAGIAAKTTRDARRCLDK